MNYASIWVIDLWEETTRAVVPGSEGHYPWLTASSMSADGKAIAYFESAEGFTLNTVRSDGTGLALINKDNSSVSTLYVCEQTCASVRLLSWSPDASSIAWMSDARIPADDTAEVNPYDNVWIAKADGTGATRLTDFTDATWRNPDLRGLDWSPDGKRIAFVRTTDLHELLASNVWTVDVASKELTNVTQFTDDYSVDLAIWSRSGDTLVFSSREAAVALIRGVRATGGPTTTRNVWAIAADGTGQRPLTQFSNGSRSWGPYWHADGKTLLFQSNIDPNNWDETMETGAGIWRTSLDKDAELVPVTRRLNGWDYSPVDVGDDD